MPSLSRSAPRGSVALTTVLLLSAPAVPAAEARKRPGRFKVGPLYLTPRLELKNAGVDSNVFQTRTGRIPDTAVVLSPALDGVLPVGRRVRLTGSGHLDLNYFRRRGSERSVDFGGDGRAELDLGPFTFYGEGGGRQAKQRFSIDLDERVLHREKWAILGAKLHLTRKISATAAGTGQVFTFHNFDLGGRSIKDILDRNTFTGTLQARYALTRRTTLLLSAEEIEDRFLSRINFARRARSVRYLGGFELGRRALVSGQVLAGFRQFPAVTSQVAAPYRGPALAIDASIPLFRFGRLNGMAQRDVFFSAARFRVPGDVLRNSYVASRYGGEAVFQLPFDLIGTGLVRYEQNKYALPFLRGGIPVRRVDHFWAVGGSLLRRFGDSVRIGGSLTFERRSSAFDEQSFDRLVYGIRAAVAP